MTRKDYIKIADVLKTADNNRDYYNMEDVFNMLLEDMSSMLLADNPNFNKTKFIDYIQGE
jgi:hypothetical protein